MISPTGKGIRQPDGWGSGYYGATRMKKGETRKHRGTDYVCIPGQVIVCPIDDAEVIRESIPYANEEYSGLILANDVITVQMFYLNPYPNIWRSKVKVGDGIGIAQDISEKYEGMTPHIHVSILSIDPDLIVRLP